MSIPVGRANRFLDPKMLAASANLQLVARTVVEGFLAGLHRSPYHGFSLDFAEYREYSPGDDIRGIDWKVFARSDRYYVKKFQGDTNSQVFLLLDTSASMGFESAGLSKLDYGRFLAAALAYLAVRQNDAVGLVSFDIGVRSFTPPRTRHGHLLELLGRLEQMDSRGKSNLAAVLESMAGTIRRRSIVVLISDFYEDPEKLAKSLRYLHQRGHDLVLFHLLDPVEKELPLEGIATLEDIETGEQIPYSAEHSRAEYLSELGRHLDSLRRSCRDIRIDYQLLQTSEPLDRALFRYLLDRSRRA